MRKPRGSSLGYETPAFSKAIHRGQRVHGLVRGYRRQAQPPVQFHDVRVFDVCERQLSKCRRDVFMDHRAGRLHRARLAPNLDVFREVALRELGHAVAAGLLHRFGDGRLAHLDPRANLRPLSCSHYE